MDDFKRVALAFCQFRGVHSYDKTAYMLMNIHTQIDRDSSKIVNIVTSMEAIL